jgi:hypothetical protein
MKHFIFTLPFALVLVIFISCKGNNSDVNKNKTDEKTTTTQKSVDTVVNKQKTTDTAANKKSTNEYYVQLLEKFITEDKFTDYLPKSEDNFIGAYTKILKDKQTGDIYSDESIYIKSIANKFSGEIAYFPGPKYNKQEGSSIMKEFKLEKNIFTSSGTEDGKKGSIKGRFVKITKGSETEYGILLTTGDVTNYFGMEE